MMSSYAYERLSAQDASFLWAERSNQPMHIGALAIFDAGPLRMPEGGLEPPLGRRRRLGSSGGAGPPRR